MVSPNHMAPPTTKRPQKPRFIFVTPQTFGPPAVRSIIPEPPPPLPGNPRLESVSCRPTASPLAEPSPSSPRRSATTWSARCTWRACRRMPPMTASRPCSAQASVSDKCRGQWVGSWRSRSHEPCCARHSTRARRFITVMPLPGLFQGLAVGFNGRVGGPFHSIPAFE